MTTLIEKLRAFAVDYPRTTVVYVMVASCLMVYIPFLGNIEMVARYFDGPLYIVVAKTFYCLSDEDAMPFYTPPVPAKYYACHLPAYPAAIRLCTFVTLGNYSLGMLMATMICAMAAARLFYDVLNEFKLVRSPLWSAILFSFLPPRWLIYHAVGATEPLFLCFVFAAFLTYKRNRPWLVVLWICLASLTRIQGVLLGPVFVLIYLTEKRWKEVFLMPISGLGLLALFWVYHVQFHDFFAYFSWNIDHEKIVRWPPLVMLFEHIRRGTPHEVEYHFGLYAFYGLATALLWRHRPLFIFGIVFFLFTLFIHHGDLTRYFLSMASIAIFIGYDHILSQKAFRVAILVAIPFFYLYAWDAIEPNVLPVTNYHSILMFQK